MRGLRAAAAACVLGVATLLAATTPAAVAGPWSGNQMVVSPDGKHLYAAGVNPLVADDGTASFVRDRTSGALTQISALEPGGHVIAISPDGRHVYVGAPQRLSVMSRDPETGLLTHQHSYRNGEDPRYPLDGVSGVVVTPDGGQVAVTSRKANAITLFARNRETGLLDPVAVRGVDALGLGQAPDGSALVTVGERELTLFRRDASTGALGGGEAHQLTSYAAAVAVTPDGRNVIAAGGGDDYTVFPRDTATGTFGTPQSSRFGVRGGHVGLIAPADYSLYGLGPSDSILTHSRLTPEGPRIVRQHSQGAGGVQGFHAPRSIALSPDGRFAYVTAASRAPDGPLDVPPGTIVSFARDPATGDLGFLRAIQPRAEERAVRAAPTLTLNARAIYTNDPRVTVNVSLDGSPPSLRLREPGGPLTPVLRRSEDGNYVFTLSPGRAARSVRRVEAVAIQPERPTSPLATDDIILDQRAPVVESAEIVLPEPAAALPDLKAALAASLTARAPRRVLRLRARDGRSGVAGFQLTRDRRRPGPLRPYRTRVKVTADQRRQWVRVRDGAGNLSRWRAVKRLTTRSIS